MNALNKKGAFATEPPKNYVLITAVLFWAGLVVMSSLYLTIPLISTFSNAFDAAPTAVAWTSSAFSFSFAIGCIFYGPVSDKYGRRPVILTGLVVLSVVSILAGFASSLPCLIFFRGVQGLAAATFSPVSLAYVADTFPPQKRVTAIGFISTGFLMAGVVGQIFSSSVNEHYGWNSVFYSLGTLYAVTFFMTFWLLPKSPAKQAGMGIGLILSQIQSLFRQKNLLCAYMIALTLLLSFVGMYTALSSYLSSSLFSLSGKQILYVRAIGILGMLLSPFAGKIAGRTGAFFVLRGGLLMAGGGLLLLGISKSLVLIVTSSILFVAGIAVVVPTIIDFVGQSGGKLRGTAVSVYTFVLFTGASIAPVLTASILKKGSHALAFFTFAFCLGAALLVSFFINEPERAQQS